MKKLLWPVLLSVLSFNATAQEELDGGGGPPRWELGLAAPIHNSPYAGEGMRIIPILPIAYNGEKFSFRGLTASWKIIGGESGGPGGPEGPEGPGSSFELSAIAKFRFDGFNVKDLGREELAQNGIDYRLLEDRDIALDGGLGMKWSGIAGEIEVELLTDITDTSGGQEVSLKYGYPMRVGNGMLTPNFGISWLSEDNANYYYGILDEEVARGVVDYKPGSTSITRFGFSYFRPIGEKWMLMASGDYNILPDEIKASPLIERDTDGYASVLIAITRGF